MHAVVVGAGAWGLPAAAELARRGHAVTLVDRHGIGNALSSSSGPTRLWRLADPDPAAVRLGQRGLEAMDRLSSRTGIEVYRRQGLLWRDDASLRRVRESALENGVALREVVAADVWRSFPGLRPDGHDALWFPDAGAVLAAESLTAQKTLFDTHGGRLVFGPRVVGVGSASGGVRVDLEDGSELLRADVAVLAPGPGAVELLRALGVDVPVRPFLEQVVHLGDLARPHAQDDWPCLFDGPTAVDPGIYAMPTPGRGYKIGLDAPLRTLRPGDTDRSPDPGTTAAIVRRAERDLLDLPARVLEEQVCSWTDSPDGWFIVDRVPGLDGVLLACGDSGKGFKYSAVMGELLADLAEGHPADGEAATMTLARFAGRPVSSDQDWVPTGLGGVPVPDIGAG